MSVYRNLEDSAVELVQLGREFHARGWVAATSGNFSARLDDDCIAITASGRHKGRLSVSDFLVVDLAGKALDPAGRPSAETILHTRLYRRAPEVGAVLHVHSANATVLSRCRPQGLSFSGYEMLKAFPGIDTHESSLFIPVFPNDQDIPRLADAVDGHLNDHPDIHGYLIAGHGLYTWGSSVADARRHVEALEFLFECELILQRTNES